ncbi:acetylcholinesterase-like isoform X2 [Ornithodoros turicata]|uniref:acetylcholinesterase-like isoform X2 n=1 Tax=Ornithodoros turicata TaxID=34597 RepID=UPI00313A329A
MKKKSDFFRPSTFSDLSDRRTLQATRGALTGHNMSSTTPPGGNPAHETSKTKPAAEGHPPAPNADTNQIEPTRARHASPPKRRKESKSSKKSKKSRTTHDGKPASALSPLSPISDELPTLSQDSIPTLRHSDEGTIVLKEDTVFAPIHEGGKAPVVVHVVSKSPEHGVSPAGQHKRISKNLASSSDSKAEEHVEIFKKEAEVEEVSVGQRKSPGSSPQKQLSVERRSWPSIKRKSFLHGLRERIVVVNIAFVLFVVSCTLTTVLVLMWFQWDLVEVPVGTYGTVRGYRFDVEGRTMYAFLGVHFAQSTSGDNRFKLPMRLDSIPHVVDATLRKPACVQTSVYVGSKSVIDYRETAEDCLHLNIWTPCLISEQPTCRKTVVIFLFGTKFQNGDNNRYDGRYFSALGDVVLVVPNFRLGAFAFVSFKGFPDTPGNLALHDQQIALEWVYNYIEHFGGQSSNIVLMGSGSGAWSIGAQLLGANSLWRARFSRIIFQGEGPLGRQYQGSVKDLSSAFNCPRRPPLAVLDCMRKTSAKLIVESTRDVHNHFGPTRDVDILSSDIYTQMNDNVIENKDIFLGSVSNEGSDMAAYLTAATAHNTVEALTELLANFEVANVSALWNVYRMEDNDTDIAHAQQLISDLLYVCPLLDFADYLASRQNRVHAYLFDYKASFSPFRDSPGAPQQHDLDFLFGVPLRNTVASTKEEEDLSRFMISIWTNFAKTGQLPDVEKTSWPSYGQHRRQQVRISLNEMNVIENYHRTQCLLIEDFLKEYDGRAVSS